MTWNSLPLKGAARKGILLAIVTVMSGLMMDQAAARAQAGFAWTSDWRVTQYANNISNVNSTSTWTQTGDFAVIGTSSVFAMDTSVLSTNVNMEIEREFELSGYVAPVRLTIQTVIDASAESSPNSWTHSVTFSSESGVGTDIRNQNTTMRVPGATPLKLISRRDLLLGNGVHMIRARLNSIILPPSIVTNGMRTTAQAQMELGFVSINGTPVAVPEPASYASIGVGLATLGLYRRYRQRRQRLSGSR